MKTLKLEAFAKDRIQENELNLLKGGYVASVDPGADIVNPPRR